MPIFVIIILLAAVIIFLPLILECNNKFQLSVIVIWLSLLGWFIAWTVTDAKIEEVEVCSLTTTQVDLATVQLANSKYIGLINVTEKFSKIYDTNSNSLEISYSSKWCLGIYNPTHKKELSKLRIIKKTPEKNGF